MKTRNIIASISILLTLVMTSCSSEGDVLSEMEGQNRPAEVAAAISCSINNMQTKASSSTESQDSVAANENEGVKNVIFFLMKGDNVLGCKTDTTAVIYTKKQTGLSVIAIANASEETADALIAKTTRAEIMNVALVASDLKSLVKIGETEINVKDDFKGDENSSTEYANVAVTVSQVAARIDLSKLTVNVKAADSKVVTLTSVSLKNQNAAGKLSGDSASFVAGNVNTTFEKAIQLEDNKMADENICSFYTFANEDQANPTTMVLNFEVDGVKTKREFTIKHSADNNIVKSGYLYRLNITVNVYGENVEPEVTFTVADWKTSQVSGSMTEVKE